MKYITINQIKVDGMDGAEAYVDTFSQKMWRKENK